MYLFALIFLTASSAFTEGATVYHLRLRRTPLLETKHQDFQHTDTSSFSMSYDENSGSVFVQNADGSLDNQTYDNKKKEMEKQEFAAKIGNVIENGPNATGKIVHYNKVDSDKKKSKTSINAGHKDIIKKPVFVEGPDGKLVISKANETYHQIYNHTTGAESSDTKHKHVGTNIEKAGGVVKQQQHYDDTLDDTRNKAFQKNVGKQIVQDQGGNFSNSTYNRSSGSQKGSHHESRKGTQDLARPNTTN
uniref:Putative secreted protein n=1 Tax=Panstrongylus lignarius TaxID=156445 RepID=A0A224XW49_9HEMI